MLCCLCQYQISVPTLLAHDTARVTLCPMPPRKRQDEPKSAGMLDPEHECGSLIPHRERDETLRAVVAALGGASVVSKLVGRHRVTVCYYVSGLYPLPSDVALILEAEARKLTTDLLSRTSELRAKAQHAEAREAVTRAANRERYFQRFGRYPVPARGNKTP